MASNQEKGIRFLFGKEAGTFSIEEVDMAEKKRIRVLVLSGGRSGEHEISLRSAASVLRFLDPERFEAIPVTIDKQGRWGSEGSSMIDLGKQSNPQNIDVVFPVMHGPLCEDGTIQGLFELADLPYVGSGVMASAVSMDKDFSKRLIRDAGLPIVPYKKVSPSFLNGKEADTFADFGFPVFVKPANLGSSVGVHKVKKTTELRRALEDAFRYDTKVIIEKGLNVREIELAVLGNLDPGKPSLVSLPGEVVPTHEFYSYEAKYLDENGAKLLIPAPLDPSQVRNAQQLAREAFEVLECEGMARVDLFLDKDSGDFYFNEVNTLPGFTSISMYPKLWEYSGIPYSELLARLIDLAIARHQLKKGLVRDYS